ncbi:MAG: DNA replication/repair protein RecF [Christensenellales bacterium]
MYIKNVTLKNYRNYSYACVDFDKGLNIIVGKNAAGKTNLVESIYCSALGKSPRSNKYKDLIKWNENSCYIKVVVAKKYRDFTIEFGIDNMDKKRVAVDGVPLTRLSGIVGIINVVFFSPDEMKLVKESPQERRRFMDISLSQQSSVYLDALSKYNQILSRRNKLLKENYNDANLSAQLYAWDVQMAKYGAQLVKSRYDFVENLAVYGGKIHEKITMGKEKLSIKYESGLKNDDIANIEKKFFEKLQQNFEKDKYLQYTSFGPHRDDMEILSNDVDMRKFGSQGQQRTVALSLKFAEIELFKKEVGESPVLLLDDVLSELDESRRSQLIEMSSSLQTIITCTEFDEKTQGHKTIKIENGNALQL